MQRFYQRIFFSQCTFKKYLQWCVQSFYLHTCCSQSMCIEVLCFISCFNSWISSSQQKKGRFKFCVLKGGGFLREKVLIDEGVLLNTLWANYFFIGEVKLITKKSSIWNLIQGSISLVPYSKIRFKVTLKSTLKY